mmetsp:Transcript_12733/g.27548  ORF Transcript_12733/g.27548 Transcript_12733/m.27548 type:complete len:223 (-) Transcript_12733:104-772(-)
MRHPALRRVLGVGQFHLEYAVGLFGFGELGAERVEFAVVDRERIEIIVPFEYGRIVALHAQRSLVIAYGIVGIVVRYGIVVEVVVVIVVVRTSVLIAMSTTVIVVIHLLVFGNVEDGIIVLLHLVWIVNVHYHAEHGASVQTEVVGVALDSDHGSIGIVIVVVVVGVGGGRILAQIANLLDLFDGIGHHGGLGGSTNAGCNGYRDGGPTPFLAVDDEVDLSQ